MAIPMMIASAGMSLYSAYQQNQAGKVARTEAEQTAKLEETAAIQREADRKDRLANALATANAQAAAAGVAAFEGSPLSILNESIRAEETATERDMFNTRISALMARRRGKSLQQRARIGAAGSLVNAAKSGYDAYGSYQALNQQQTPE